MSEQIARSSTLGQICVEFEGGISYRDKCINRGSLALDLNAGSGAMFKKRFKNIESVRRQMKSVVVMKFRPVKFGDSVEEKTGMAFGERPKGLHHAYYGLGDNHKTLWAIYRLEIAN